MYLEANGVREYLNLVDGEWIKSNSGNTIEIHSPADGSLVGKIQANTTSEVDEVVKASKKNLIKWAETPIYERANILNQTASLLEERLEEISDVLVMEIAKDKKLAVSEVKRTADFLRFTADAGKNVEGLAVGGENFPGGLETRSRSYREFRLERCSQYPLSIIRLICRYQKLLPL